MISKVCAGFFEDPRHLELQFSYQTDSNISRKIEKVLMGHLGNIFNGIQGLLYLIIFVQKIWKFI